MLTWARQRSRLEVADLSRRFPRLAQWEQGEAKPTLKQLEGFAQATHTPVGFLFLEAPPEEPLPLTDYRTMGDAGVRRPSPDLLDTIYDCQQRQDWYRQHAILNREEPVGAVGSASVSVPAVEAASLMREALRFSPAERGSSWSEALRLLRDRSEELGILVMISGVVGSNTHRKLDPHEFRGFALVDPLAPLVFVNGADTKAAQLFTLVHELAHLWLGEAGLDDVDPAGASDLAIERWCNEVAAELLVPADAVMRDKRQDEPLEQWVDRLARQFKVSTLVALRRLYELNVVDRSAYWSAYQAEVERLVGILEERGGGGNFFNTQPARVSPRFARAVVASTLEGQTLYRDAFSLLGFKKVSTFEQLATRLGF